MKCSQSILRAFSVLIGRTPLLRIDCTFQGTLCRVYAKAEYFNLTGSIKDRMALHILWRALECGQLKPDTTIVEATSGNTGIALSALGGALGCRVMIFMPDWMSAERIRLMESFGASVHLVSHAEGGFLGSIEKARRFAEETPDALLADQFANQSNAEAHYLTTGPEIDQQLRMFHARPDAFVAGVGTGGTIMGVGRYLREKFPALLLFPLEPANSPTLSTGHQTGKHRIQGISDELIPPLLDLTQLNHIVSVDDGDAIMMAQKLATHGVGVGISSGANFLGALKCARELGEDKTVVTVFVDDNKKYLTTDLMREEPRKEAMMTPDVEIIQIKAVRMADDGECGCC